MGSGSWRWSLPLVAAVHLLTIPGTWCVTDQAETLFNARRLVRHGTLRLTDPGVDRVPALPWVRGESATGLRSRLLPLSTLTLAPLVAVDQLLGLGEPLTEGRFAHLQGFLLTLLALALFGWSARRLGASDAATAAALLLVGLCWPVWRASLRGGAEPVMMLLVCVYLAGVACERGQPAFARRGALLRASACLLLPWANPVGTVLGAALVAAAGLEWCWPTLRGGAPRAPLWPAVLGSALGNLGVLVIWNHAYHGDLWRGGYAAYNVIRFAEVPLLRGLELYVGGTVAQVGLLLAASVAATVAAKRPARLILPALLTASVIVVFATHYLTEPARRLSPVWPAWGLVAAVGWDRMRWPPAASWLLVVGQALLGFQGFMGEHGRYYEGPGGLYYPWVLWVKLALDGRSWWQTAAPVVVLLAVMVTAVARLRVAVRSAADGGAT